MSQRPDPRRQLVGEAEIDQVAEAVRDSGRAYVRAGTTDVDLPNFRVGAALSIIEEETDLIELYRETCRGGLYRIGGGDRDE